MLKEELHISRVQKTVHAPETVVVRRESVSVERIDPSGDPQADHNLTASENNSATRQQP